MDCFAVYSGISNLICESNNSSVYYENSLGQKKLNPWFVTGFADAFGRGQVRYHSVKGSCTDNNLGLVIWGTNLGSQVGTGVFTKQIRDSLELPTYQFSIVIGLLLSDGWLIIASKRSKNARLGFKQSLARGYYVWFVFNALSHYCSSYPRLTKGHTRGKQYPGLEFFTRSLPCFTHLHSLFYPQGTKIIPSNIYELLTPVALAHLIMGDGQASSSGLILCTNSYSIPDIVRLMNVLIIRYRLECNIREFRSNRKLEYMIYIRQGSMPLLRTIVKSHMITSMLYKLENSKVSSNLT